MRTHTENGTMFSSSHMMERQPSLLPFLAQLHFQQAEKRLMRAVLMDAVGCIERYRDGQGAQSWPAFHAARGWMLDQDRSWPFSFENICLALDLDPDRLRSLLFALPFSLQRSA